MSTPILREMLNIIREKKSVEAGSISEAAQGPKKKPNAKFAREIAGINFDSISKADLKKFKDRMRAQAPEDFD